MYTIDRRGFTLVELLVALVLGALVASGIYQALVGTQRASHAGMQQIEVQENLRAGVGYLSAVLRELDAADGDIAVATPTRLDFRSMRWTGTLCTNPFAGPGSSVIFPIRQSPVFGFRGPEPIQDSLFVYRDGDPSTRSDDVWLVGALTAVGVTVCADGSPASALTVEITAGSGGQAAALVGVTPGAPLRGFQQEEVTLFSDVDGRWWMGQRAANRSGAWTSVQAIVGPLTASGLFLTYFDSTGAATATLTDIASIAVALHAESSSLVRRGGGSSYAQDSVLTRVALRNNPRF